MQAFVELDYRKSNVKNRDGSYIELSLNYKNEDGVKCNWWNDRKMSVDEMVDYTVRFLDFVGCKRIRYANNAKNIEFVDRCKQVMENGGI